MCKHPGNEDAMRNQFQPGVHETRCFGGSQDVEGVAADKANVGPKKTSQELAELVSPRAFRKSEYLPEGSECLEVDGFQDVFRGVELQQQHDENAVIRQLLEFSLTNIVVLDQHANDDTEHLWR